MSIEKKIWLEGLVPAVFTPMKENGDINFSQIEPYCEYLINNNITEIYVNGTTGEGKSLTKEERKEVVEHWIKVSKKRLIIIVHVGCINVKESQELARHAQDVGADAVASLPSLFFKPSNIDALVHHCAEIAKTAPKLPFIYYHLPIMTGVELNMEDFSYRAQKEIPNFGGIKFSSKDLPDMIGVVFSGVNVLFGCDEQFVGGLAMGAHGGVGSLYNFMPKIYHKMIALIKQGSLPEAREEQMKGQRLCRVMYKYGNLQGGNVAALKQIMSYTGVEMGPPRSPMRECTKEEKEKFKNELKAIGFFEWL
ncbi:N-acetylneuraminate lyase-like [Mytilus trossulus]|uniref:N-acetylneuraminate lyase-like n=1 Tax=Mytilus trossulus TaxID=6551 RepID=UPI00300769E8